MLSQHQKKKNNQEQLNRLLNVDGLRKGNSRIMPINIFPLELGEQYCCAILRRDVGFWTSRR